MPLQTWCTDIYSGIVRSSLRQHGSCTLTPENIVLTKAVATGRGFIHYRYGTVSLTASKQQYGTVSRFQTAIDTVPWVRDFKTSSCLVNLTGPCCLTDAEKHVCHFSPKQKVVTLPSLSCSLSQPRRQTFRADHTSFIPMRISARTDVYKYSFFPRTLLDWNTLSAKVRLKYSLSASESADLVD